MPNAKDRSPAYRLASGASDLEKLDPFLSVELRGDEIVVIKGDFFAVYYMPNDWPQLILRRRADTDHHALLASPWQAANAKAHELGWIA